MHLFLQHTPQPWPWGCQYFSLYSLTGDERILDDVTECNSTRFEERARELGYFIYRVYADVTCTVPMPKDLWGRLFGGPEGIARLQGFEMPFLIDIDSLRMRGVKHTVAITLTGVAAADTNYATEDFISVKVFDPGAAGEKYFPTLPDFLASPYGRVYELKQVMPIERFDELFPKHFGPDAAHVRPEVRQAWAASLVEKEAA
jgi:hypothetical protein